MWGFKQVLRHFNFQVNNGDVDLDRKSRVDNEFVCYTAVNPFHVRLLNHQKKREKTQFRLSKKRAKSPTRKVSTKGDRNKSNREKSPTMSPSSENDLSQPNGKFSVKLGKISGVRCTPESKRRRRSRIVGPVDLH